MKNRKKTAFTIVELVIVIAVIGILAAVLIPTFSGVIKSANIANDQSNAANLTIELRMATQGELIENEEQLMTALDQVDQAKRSPKSINYGYHFWFDMETQTVILETADEIKAKTPSEIDASSASSFRDIYGNGYYLIDSDSSFLGNAAEIEDADDYLAFIEDIKNNSNSSYDELAEYILDRIENTTIRNQYGVFYFATRDNVVNGETVDGNFEYFAPGVKSLGGAKYIYDGTTVNEKGTGTSELPPSPIGGIVYLPKSVILVEEGALDYVAGKNVTIMTDCKTVEEIVSIFAPASTNAVILAPIAGDNGNSTNYIVTTGPAGGSNAENAEITDVLHKYNGEGVASEWKADLVKKLPFETFEIGFDEVANFVVWNTDTLYIYITAEADLFAKNGNDRSESVKEWKPGDETILTIGKDGKITALKYGTTTITATAVNLYGTEIEKTINVVVNAPKSVNIEIDDMRFNLNETQGKTTAISWTYEGQNALTPALWKGEDGTGSGIEYYNKTFAKGTGDINVSIKEGSFFKKEGNTLSYGGSGDTTFTVSVDGWGESTFDVSVINNSDAIAQVNFHNKSNNKIYAYYIGNKDAVTVGALFDVKNSTDTLNSATLTIYTGKYGDGPLANGSSQTLSSTEWRNSTIDVSGKSGTVYIMVTPINDDSMLYKFEVVDAYNVEYDTSDANTITVLNNKLSDGNAVLHTDLNVVTGQTINVGDKTLYGNGYVIDAQKYVAELIATSVKETYQWCSKCNDYLYNCTGYNDGEGYGKGYHDYEEMDGCDTVTKTKSYIENKERTKDQYDTDVAMIELSSGTIDNIYINGPVYPVLQYYMNNCVSSCDTAHADTKYYVSGIKVTGAATIKNSYVCGFRQPVKADGTSLSLDNVTLRGGNMANLLLSKGNLNLNDVTTIQDQNGMTDTINTSGNVSVTGMGILLEPGALASKINIDGYLNQYNWVKQGQSATLPTITTTDGVEMNLDTIFGYLFTGMSGVEIGSVKYFIHKDNTSAESDETKASNNYVNAGIAFVEVGTEAYLDTLSIGVNITHAKDREAGVMAKTTFDELNMRFKDEGLASIINAADFLKTDGIFYIWSYKDGRQWYRPEMSIENIANGSALQIHLSEGSTPSVILDATKTQTPSGEADTSFGNYTGKYVPLIYRGYYDDFGCYADEYVVNPDNTITANTSN